MPLRFSGFDPTAADVSSNLREPFLKRVQASDAQIQFLEVQDARDAARDSSGCSAGALSCIA